MIELTRLNGNRLAVNGDLIQFAEAAPDTLLTMVTGEKMLVSESLAEVSERMLAFRVRTLAEAGRLQAEGFAVGAALRAVASKNARVEAQERVYETDTDEDGDEAGAGLTRRRRRATL
jgi:flagellar protein FlbD